MTQLISFPQLGKTAAPLFFQWAGLPWRGCCEPALPEHLWLVGQAGDSDSEEERGVGGEGSIQVLYQWLNMWLTDKQLKGIYIHFTIFVIGLKCFFIIACEFLKP